MNASPEIAVSTWAVHDRLGSPPVTTPLDEPTDAGRPATTVEQLSDTCDLLRGSGVRRVELCHFHVPGTRDAELAAVRDVLAEHGLTLSSLLIDSGDVAADTDRERHLSWLEAWIDRAAAMGAEGCRIASGRAAPSAAVTERVMAGWRRLAAAAERAGVRPVTENWREYTDTPETLLRLLDAMDGRVGLCLDFKNWAGRFDDLQQLAPRATSCHVPACGTDAADAAALGVDVRRCLRMTSRVGFTGVYTIVGTAGDDPGESLRRSADVIAAATGAVRHRASEGRAVA